MEDINRYFKDSVKITERGLCALWTRTSWWHRITSDETFSLLDTTICLILSHIGHILKGKDMIIHFEESNLRWKRGPLKYNFVRPWLSIEKISKSKTAIFTWQDYIFSRLNTPFVHPWSGWELRQYRLCTQHLDIL